MVVGHVLEREKHPNADKLSVCTVDVGAQDPIQIVCGASNVRAGSMFRWPWSVPPSPPLA